MTHEILARLGLDTQDFNQGVESASGSMSNLGKVAMAGLGLAAGAVGGAILGIGAAAWEVGTEIDSASRQMAASLGMTLDESEHLKDAMLDVWSQGLNSSIEETGAAITIVSQSMKSLADDDIANATASALKLQGVFEDADLERSTSAANSLMKEFGLTSEEAFDYLAGGYQKGLNSSGDFLDSINEYGVLFDQAGFTADEMFSIMETGLQAGALGTDKIADGIKEFGIRVQELSDDQLDTLKLDLGIDSKAFYDGMIDGSLSVADAYKMVADGLAEIENPIHRNSAGVKFFGAAWEDMGAEAFLATSTATTSLGDLSGSMDALNVRYEDFSGIAERLKRRFLVGLLPMRDSLLSLANEAMPYVESAFGWFENNLPAIFNTASQAISLLGASDLEGLANLWADAGPKVEAFAIQIYTWIESTKEILKEKFMTWGQAVTGWLIENSPLLIQAAQNLTSTLIDFIIAKAFEIQTSFLGWGQAAVGWLVTSAPSIIVKAEEFYIGLFTWVGSKAIELHTRFLEWGQGLVGWLITSAPDMLVKAEEIGISLLAWVSSKSSELQVRFLEWGYAVVAWIAPSASDMLIQVETLGVNFLNWISVKAIEITAGFVTWAQSLIAWIGPAAVDFLAEWPLMLYDFLTWIEQSAAPILLQLGDWALSFIEWVAPMIPDLLIGLGAVTLALTAFIVETAVVLGVKLVEWAAAFVGWIATEAVPRLWDALQAMEDALFEWVDWGVSWLLEQGKNLGSSLLDGILSMLQNAGGTIGALLEEAIWAGVNQIKNTFKIWSPSRVFANEIGAPIVEGVAQGIFKKSNVVKESLNDAINDAIDSPGLFLDYFSYMMEEGKYLDDSLATLPPSLSASMEEIGHALVPTGEVYKGLTSYLDGVMGDGDYLNDYLSEMPFSIKSSVQAIGEALAIDPSSHEALLEYLSFTLKEGDYLNDYLADLPDALKPAAEIIGKNLGYGGDIYKDLSNYLAAVNQDGELLNVHLEQLPKSIQASAQAMGQFLSSEAATMTSSMDSALPEMAVTFSENASADAIQELDSYFEGWVGEEKEWLIEQGNELGDALLGGILVILENAGGIIAEVLTQSIENALAQVKATYGIASPSRVFADEIGSPLAQGIASGVSGGQVAIADAVTSSIDYGKSLASFPKQTDNKVKEAKASNSQQTNTITVHVTAEAGREQIAAQAVRLELDNALMRARARGLNA